MSSDILGFVGSFLGGGVLSLVLIGLVIRLIRRRAPWRKGLWALVVVFVGTSLTCLLWAALCLGYAYFDHSYWTWNIEEFIEESGVSYWPYAVPFALFGFACAYENSLKKRGSETGEGESDRV